MRRTQNYKTNSYDKIFLYSFFRRIDARLNPVISCSALSFCPMRKCVLLCSLVVFLQSANAQFFDEVLSNYTSLLTPEKAYLHLDKSAYTPGETIWFKAYVLDDIFPAANSKTMYVDWIGSNGDVRIVARSSRTLCATSLNGRKSIAEASAPSSSRSFARSTAYT